MISNEESARLRERLREVLAEDAHNTQRLVTRLEAISRESGVGAHAALLLILTHLAFEEQEARQHWQSILAHHQQLSSVLGRDPGLRTAVLDYFVNINRHLVQPTLIDLEMLESGGLDAARDRVTGLVTDRTFRTSLQHELRRARRYHQRATVVLFDLDDFAEVNRRVGALVGDRLLREAAILLVNNCRDIDTAGRPGEDELALLLPETDRNAALLVADRYRRELESFFSRRQSDGGPVGLTVSAGVAGYPDDATAPETLLQHAAQALYEAKAAGKNGIQLYRPERRRYLRFELEPGRFEIEVLASADRTSGKLRNYSRSGILFVAPEPLEVGEEIEIRLADPGDAPESRRFRVQGRVVRLEELSRPLGAANPGEGDTIEPDRFEIGVAFDQQWAEGRDDLVKFLELAQGQRTGH